MNKSNRKNWREYIFDFFKLIFYPITLLFHYLSDLFYEISCKLHKKKNCINGNKKQDKLSKIVIRKNIFIWMVLAVPIIQFIIFYVCVNTESILLAFQRYDIETETYVWHENIFANFKEFISNISHDASVKQYILNSLALYLLGYITLPLTLFFSFYIVKKLRLASTFSIILFLPHVISGVVMVTMFKYMFEYTIPSIIGYKGKSLLLREDLAFWLLWLFGLWTRFGSNILIYMSTMSRVPESLVESARLEGITLFKEFIYIYFPLIFPTVATFLVLGVGTFLMTKNAAYTFYAEQAPKSARTLEYYFFTMVVGRNAGYANYPYASAAGLLVTMISVPVALSLRYIINKKVPVVDF